MQLTVLDILSGRRKGPLAAAARLALLPPAACYSAAMRLRRWAYHGHLLKSLPALSPAGQRVPVICVGNITTGGTGKTPMVAWLVRQLAEMGRHPAVLTRGYKAVEGISDEAELLRQQIPAGKDGWTVPVIINPDRVAGARSAAATGADVIVMDDGFQHRRLRRDLDIVLVDATNPFGFGHCLPRGLLREPPSALADAGAIVITHSDQVAVAELNAIRSRLASLAPQSTIHLAVHRPRCLIDPAGREADLKELAGRKTFTFCGLANPGSFFATAAGLGASIAGQAALSDHAAYTQAKLDDLAASAAHSHADVLLTTQKDFVKLACLQSPMPLWQLAVAMELAEGEELLLNKTRAVL